MNERHCVARCVLLATTTFACLSMVAADALAAGESASPLSQEAVVELWRRTLAEGDYATVMATYELADELADAEGHVSEETCRKRADDLNKALQTNPVGLALHIRASECALALDDETTSERHLETFAALVRHAVAAQPQDNGATPLVVMAEADAVAFVRASGHELLYSYYDAVTKGRRLPLMVALWDEQDARERIYSFDYLDAQMQLRRKEEFAQFAYFRRAFANSIIATFGATPDSIASEALAVRQVLENPQLAARMDGLELLARQNNFGAATGFVYACLISRHDGCPSKALDMLLPWAEARVSAALVAMAVFHDRGVGVKRSEKAAREMLDLADRRLGEARASTAFVGVQIVGRKSPEISAFTRKRLTDAAKSGSTVAMSLIAALEMDQHKGKPLSRKTRAGLEHAAQAGTPAAQHLLGTVLLGEGKREQGLRWLGAAAEADYTPAQVALAVDCEQATDARRDLAKARHWRVQAAHGGDVGSMIWLARHHALLATSAENRFQQEGWLQSAAYVGSIDATVALADLLVRGGEGLSGDSARAASIYREIVAKHDRADARRALALLLLDGAKGVDKDPAEARRLLLADAEKSDPHAQAILGARMLDASFGSAEPAGAEWLQKAVASDDAEALLTIGGVLYYGRGIARDRANGIKAWERAAGKGARMASNNLAWALCTADDKHLFDPQRGLGVAAWLNKDDKQSTPSSIDTEAACHAANGEFERAAKMQEEAIRLIEQRVAGSRVLERMRARVDLYGKRQRYVEVEVDDGS